jgi:hypothetical protein
MKIRDNTCVTCEEQGREKKMRKDSRFKKKFIVGGIVLSLILILTPSSPATLLLTKPLSQNNRAPMSSENYSFWNITLPMIHIQYEKNKWKWGVVQFDDFEPIIDVNLSRFEPGLLFLGFNETVKCYPQDQLLPASFLVTLEFFYNGSYLMGYSVGDYAWRIRNWTKVVHNGYLYFPTDLNQTFDIQGKITATGVPVRLHRVYLSLVVAIFWYVILEKTLLPFEERHGVTIEFTLHVHR